MMSLQLASVRWSNLVCAARRAELARVCTRLTAEALFVVAFLGTLLVAPPVHAITRVAATSANTGASQSNSLTISVPGGIVSGDVLVAAISVRNPPPNITAPAGWTAIRNDKGGGKVQTWLYYKVV